jgi:hypothetical protein
MAHINSALFNNKTHRKLHQGCQCLKQANKQKMCESVTRLYMKQRMRDWWLTALLTNTRVMHATPSGSLWRPECCTMHSHEGKHEGCHATGTEESAMHHANLATFGGGESCNAALLKACRCLKLTLGLRLLK